MYDVHITNNYIYDISLEGSSDTVSAKGGTKTFTGWGSHILHVPGMGEMNFLDLGDKKLAQYTNPDLPWTECTWGGLVRYKGLDVYFRYEGGGGLNVEFNSHGCAVATFTRNGGMVVSLDDLSTGEDA